MTFVYHQVPPGMVGETLYPLKTLERLEPTLYKAQIAKYNDHPARQRIPYQSIPKLGCSRAETLNFAPLHPRHIYLEWETLGVTLPEVRWYKIPVRHIAHLPAVIYKPGEERSVGDDIPEDRVDVFNPATYEELTALPQKTRDWYLSLHTRGRKGAWFAHVPHVLVRGAVSVREAEVIDWRDAL